ncbi:MAG TPA: ComF family protein [Gammaproteobacteria bacterium]
MVYKWPAGDWLGKGRAASAIVKTAWTTAFPSTCLFCGADGRSGMDLCEGCLQELPLITLACHGCGLPLTGAANARPLCGRCLRKPAHFDRTCCPYVYKQPVDWLIGRLKFNARLSHIKVLGGLLQEHLERIGADCPELIIPVPMHPGRQRQRGFNQALEIARPLARHYNVPLATGLCVRHLDTPPQRELPAKRRATNVRNAFHLRKPLNASHIAIVDDVMTTGATVNELARLLKRHGAEYVQVWVLARTAVD